MRETCRKQPEKPHQLFPTCSSWKRAGESKDMTKDVKEICYKRNMLKLAGAGEADCQPW